MPQEKYFYEPVGRAWAYNGRSKRLVALAFEPDVLNPCVA